MKPVSHAKKNYILSRPQKTTTVAPPKLQYHREGLIVAHGVKGWRRLAPYKQKQALSTRFLPLFGEKKANFSNWNNPDHHQDDGRCSTKAPIRTGGTDSSARCQRMEEIGPIQAETSPIDPIFAASWTVSIYLFVPACDYVPRTCNVHSKGCCRIQSRLIQERNVLNASVIVNQLY